MVEISTSRIVEKQRKIDSTKDSTWKIWKEGLIFMWITFAYILWICLLENK